MHEDRRLLRALLARLIAERSDADTLYVPRGEAGQRRMIRALLALRPPEPEGTALYAQIQAFYALEEASRSGAEIKPPAHRR